MYHFPAAIRSSSMKPLTILFLCTSLIAGCSKTESVHNPPAEPVDPSASNAGIQQPSQDVPITMPKSPNAEDYKEPQITGRLSTNIKDAEGKKLTRCEYRYLSKSGDFLSVFVDFTGAAKLNVIEKKGPDAEPTVHPKSQSAHVDSKYLDTLLHKLDTYGHQSGPLMWLEAPERPNWADDDSTTWIIMTYQDVQFIVSSRQQLPEHRYKGFNAVYTYLTSFVPGFKRKMRQNIGEPAPDIIRSVHGKEVRLVPGTGNTVLDGAEIDYGDKLWWIEEELVGTFESTPQSLEITKQNTEAGIPISASMHIRNDGNFTLTIDKTEYIGSLSPERLYNSWMTAWIKEKTEQSQKELAEKGRFDYGTTIHLSYDGESDDPDVAPQNMYNRLIIRIEGEPYVQGRGYTPSQTIYIDRK